MQDYLKHSRNKTLPRILSQNTYATESVLQTREIMISGRPFIVQFLKIDIELEVILKPCHSLFFACD